MDSQQMAGRLVLACQLTGWLSILGGLAVFAKTFDDQADPALVGYSALFMVAAALAFGLAANAVLRK